MAFLKRNPIFSYFLFTFLISWGAVLTLIVLYGLPPTLAELNAQLPFAVPAMLLGPSISGILFIGVSYGIEGFKHLKTRMLTWSFDPMWYLAILLGPLCFLTVAVGLSWISSEYRPAIFDDEHWIKSIVLGVLSGVFVGIFEELGWTGYATVALRSKFSVTRTGLIIGIVWGAWHILSNDVWAIHTFRGSFSPVLFVVLRGFGFLIGFLVPFRIILVWIHDQTRSLPLVMLMHASLTASALIFGPSGSLGLHTLVIDVTQAIAMWLILGFLIKFATLSYTPKHKRKMIKDS